MNAESRELTRTWVRQYEGPTYADCLALLVRQLETMAREDRVVTILSIGLGDDDGRLYITVTFEE